MPCGDARDAAGAKTLAVFNLVDYTPLGYNLSHATLCTSQLSKQSPICAALKIYTIPVYLLSVFPKARQANLTSAQCHDLKHLTRILKG